MAMHYSSSRPQPVDSFLSDIPWANMDKFLNYLRNIKRVKVSTNDMGELGSDIYILKEQMGYQTQQFIQTIAGKYSLMKPYFNVTSETRQQ